jgi:Na+-translocating ferredoxin:NAD+ oxidoreductase RNF subunit RnfB
MTALIAAAALALLAALLASVLLLASRQLRVAEDPRLATVEAALPGVNCGACGQPSCQAFAEALLAGTAVPAACTVSSPQTHAQIAAFLGVGVGSVRRQVARLACAGGRNVAPHRALYLGEQTCAAAATVGGGAKACRWGCLHYGDCERACTFAAIRMDAHGLPVVDEAACTACGDCVSACPKDLFRLEPVDHTVWVNCNNPEFGNRLLDVCAVACTTCGRCAQDAPEQIRMADNLPVVDASRGNPPRAAIERCPTGAIVWIVAGRQQLGAAAARPLRVRDLPVQSE